MISLKSALIVYWSNTGNTEKVAYAIKEGLEDAGLKVDLKKPQEAAEKTFSIMIWFVLVLHQLSGNPLNPWLIC